MTDTLGGKLAPTHPDTPTATATRSRLSPWARGAHQAGSSCFRRPSTSPGKAGRWVSSGSEEREAVLGLGRTPFLGNLASGGCSHFKPGLGSPASPRFRSITGWVFSPGALHLKQDGGTRLSAAHCSGAWPTPSGLCREKIPPQARQRMLGPLAAWGRSPRGAGTGHLSFLPPLQQPLPHSTIPPHRRPWSPALTGQRAGPFLPACPGWGPGCQSLQPGSAGSGPHLERAGQVSLEPS